MTKDEALTLALETLESCVATCFDRYAHEQVMSRPEHFVNQTITAIHEALAQPAAQAEANEADQLLTALRLDPDTYRTVGGWLNIPKIMAAITSPADYPYTKEQSK